MKNILNLALTLSLVLALASSADARPRHNDNDLELEMDEEVTFDCEYVYNLEEDTIEQYNLPSLELNRTVQLPGNARGREITIAGNCSDHQQTILVIAKRRGHGKFVYSYTKDLQFIAEIRIDDLVEGSDNENDRRGDRPHDENDRPADFPNDIPTDLPDDIPDERPFDEAEDIPADFPEDDEDN